MQLHETEIDGARFKMNQLGFVQGRQALARLVKIAGPAIGLGLAKLEVTGAGDVKNLQKLLSSDVGNVLGAVGVALERFSSAISEEDLAYFHALFAPVSLVAVPERPDAFVKLVDAQEIVFGGGGMHRYVKWIWWGIRINFEGFFSAFSSKLDDAGESAPGSLGAPTSSSPTSLTGKSIAS